MERIKNIGTEKARQKIRHYCAYQERSHQEVINKLYSYGLYKKEVDELVSGLVEENFLNEERFALAFAGGKFRVRQWGKVKIKYELRQRGVSDYSIKKALAAIIEDDYQATLEKLCEAKIREVGGVEKLSGRSRVQQYLIQKGYEPSVVYAMVKKLATAGK